MRAASKETADGIVYTVSEGRKGGMPEIYAFTTKSEKSERLGPAAVGSSGYITSIDVDPSGRYLYYVPGAHGGADKDGSPVVQYDIKKKSRKVIAYLHPYFADRYGVAPVGTYSYALTPNGDKLCITWNANRGGRVWDCVAISVIHIPESERKP
jgi:hypothetical protein